MAIWAALLSALQQDKEGRGGIGQGVQMPQRNQQGTSQGGPIPQTQGRGLAALQAPQGSGGYGAPGSPLQAPYQDAPEGQNRPLAKSSDFWDKFGERFERIGDGAVNLAGGIASTGAVNNLFAPSRATNRWQPNRNPGLAGLQAQLEGSWRGGYGRR